MKRLLLATLLCLPATCLAGGAYVVEIDGTPHEVDLDQAVTLPSAHGDVTVRLTRKPTATFSLDGVSFDYPSSAPPPAVADLGDGVRQVVVILPTGSAFMLQLYTGMRGDLVLPLLVEGVMSDEKKAGYRIEREPVARTMADGKTMTGTHVSSRSGVDSYDRVFLACDRGDDGVTVLTQIGDVEHSGDAEIISGILATLRPGCSD